MSRKSIIVIMSIFTGFLILISVFLKITNDKIRYMDEEIVKISKKYDKLEKKYNELKENDDLINDYEYLNKDNDEEVNTQSNLDSVGYIYVDEENPIYETENNLNDVNLDEMDAQNISNLESNGF